jgi:hypothetical protein
MATDTEVRDLLTKKITEKGFPVIAVFDFVDSNAGIWAKSAKEVLVDDYGGNFLNDGVKGDKVKLTDLSESGLFKLYDEGSRPDDKPDRNKDSYDDQTAWFSDNED